MKVLTRFACYDQVVGGCRTTFRVVCENEGKQNARYWIEEKRSSGKGWFRAFRPYAEWTDIQDLLNSYELRLILHLL